MDCGPNWASIPLKHNALVNELIIYKKKIKKKKKKKRGSQFVGIVRLQLVY
jgi:hypothetical protein